MLMMLTYQLDVHQALDLSLICTLVLFIPSPSIAVCVYCLWQVHDGATNRQVRIDWLRPISWPRLRLRIRSCGHVDVGLEVAASLFDYYLRPALAKSVKNGQ